MDVSKIKRRIDEILKEEFHSNTLRYADVDYSFNVSSPEGKFTCSNVLKLNEFKKSKHEVDNSATSQKIVDLVNEKLTGEKTSNMLSGEIQSLIKDVHIPNDAELIGLNIEIGFQTKEGNIQCLELTRASKEIQCYPPFNPDYFQKQYGFDQ